MPRIDTPILTPEQVLARFSGGPNTGVFTDGSCEGNPGRGGWGYVMVKEGKVVAQNHGSDPDTTNNRMELMALAIARVLLAPTQRNIRGAILEDRFEDFVLGWREEYTRDS